MRIHRRTALGSFLSVLAIGPSFAAEPMSVLLADTTKPGDAFQLEIDLSLTGTMKLDRGEKVESVPLEAKAKHRFVEGIESIANGNSPAKSCRYYTEAASVSLVGIERGKRTLSETARGILVQSDTNGPVHFGSTGPLTRDELALVAEHFDTLSIPQLLPGKEVKVGETWEIRSDIAQAVCLFDGLISTTLTGKLTDVRDGMALFNIEGTAEGIEQGATAKLLVNARGRFDIAKQRVVSLEWDQTDDRKQGPVSPASEAKATIKLARMAAQPTKELNELRAKWPTDGKIPELLTQLRHRDESGYEMVYPRNWHIVVQNDKHLVMRFLNRGELITQATITAWKPKPENTDAKAIVTEFVEATRKQPGWEPSEVLENGAVPAGQGKQVYRISASGKQDGLPVVQSFFLVSGTQGEHKAIVFVSTSTSAAKIGTADVALVAAIDLSAKK